VAALEWQAREFSARTGILCKFACAREQLVVPAEAGTAAFRIVQETLTNVARHAQATSVSVELQAGGGQLTLTIKDNGRGITDLEIAHSRSFGLLGMRERAALLGGEFTISGAPGQGTTVAVKLPFKDIIAP